MVIRVHLEILFRNNTITACLRNQPVVSRNCSPICTWNYHHYYCCLQAKKHLGSFRRLFVCTMTRAVFQLLSFLATSQSVLWYSKLTNWYLKYIEVKAIKPHHFISIMASIKPFNQIELQLFWMNLIVI